jgi:hypothetical protein
VRQRRREDGSRCAAPFVCGGPVIFISPAPCVHQLSHTWGAGVLQRYDLSGSGGDDEPGPPDSPRISPQGGWRGHPSPAAAPPHPSHAEPACSSPHALPAAAAAASGAGSEPPAHSALADGGGAARRPAGAEGGGGRRGWRRVGADRCKVRVFDAVRVQMTGRIDPRDRGGTGLPAPAIEAVQVT